MPGQPPPPALGQPTLEDRVRSLENGMARAVSTIRVLDTGFGVVVDALSRTGGVTPAEFEAVGLRWNKPDPTAQAEPVEQAADAEQAAEG